MKRAVSHEVAVRDVQLLQHDTMLQHLVEVLQKVIWTSVTVAYTADTSARHASAAAVELKQCRAVAADLVQDGVTNADVATAADDLQGAEAPGESVTKSMW